jgi:transposase
MKKEKLVIGIDISKSKLDVCIIKNIQEKQLAYLQVSNCPKGIKELFKTLKAHQSTTSDMIFCFLLKLNERKD